MTDSIFFSFLNNKSETDVVTVSDNIVHDYSFSNTAFSLPTLPSSPSF
jgi:hypothetical protein